MNLVGKTYRWETWDITFKEDGVLESVGDFKGKGKYTKIGDLEYFINIKDTKYIFTFKNGFSDFISDRYKDGQKQDAFNIGNQNLTSDSALLDKKYRWGSWDITFEADDVLDSVGDFMGKGKYTKIGDSEYDINIKGTKYIFTFKNGFSEFMSKRFDGKTEYAYII